MHTTLETSLGELTFVAEDGALVGIFQEQQPNRLSSEEQGEWASQLLFRDEIEQLEEYLSGERKEFNLNVKMKGTDFQTSVWRAISTIPYGERVTYADLATSIGKPTAYRAVASAVGLNPLTIVIPCHRVVSRSGAEKYSGGVVNKKILLDLENNKS